MPFTDSHFGDCSRTSILHYRLESRKGYLAVEFSIYGYIPVGIEDIIFTLLAYLTLCVAYDFGKALACKIEIYLFFVKFHGFTGLDKYMLDGFVFKGV